MPNSFFQFKQFGICQQKAAMKVSTDSCLFGAWVASYAGQRLNASHRILDVGTGTGLLMLMLAQQSEAMIEGIEIDEAAATEASYNCKSSGWRNRLQVLQADVRQFSCEGKYDLIISNPPFYERSLLSESRVQNIAHHDTGLTLYQLVAFIATALKQGGSFAVLVPFFRETEIIDLCTTKKLMLQQRVRVQHAADKPFIRSMLWFQQKTAIEAQEQVISIYSEKGVYSADFSNLLQPYYLFI